MNDKVEDKGVLRKRARVPFAMVPKDVFIRPISFGARVLYGYLLGRSDQNGMSFPGYEHIADDIHASVGSVKNFMKELVDDHWVRRIRRFGTSSLTYIYESQEYCIEEEKGGIVDEEDKDYKDQVGYPVSPRQLAGYPTISYQDSPLNENQINEKKIKRVEEFFSPADVGKPDMTAQLQELERIKREGDEALAAIKKTSTERAEKRKGRALDHMADNRAVQHFQDEEVMRVISVFYDLYNIPIPSANAYDRSAVKDWASGARQIIQICEGHKIVDVLKTFKAWRDRENEKRGEEDIVTRPGSITNRLRGFMAQYQPERELPEIELDEYGIPILYGNSKKWST